MVKVGGGLCATPGALDVVGRALAEAGRRHRLLVVPGGGPFADAVRAFDRREGLSADAAHWMAILAMDQYAYVLVERIPGAVLVEEPGTIGAALGGTGVAVLAPSRWLRAADVLPHDWGATSDSAAAFVAGALDAERLVLIKPEGGGSAAGRGGSPLRAGVAGGAAVVDAGMGTGGRAGKAAGRIEPPPSPLRRRSAYPATDLRPTPSAAAAPA